MDTKRKIPTGTLSVLFLTATILAPAPAMAAKADNGSLTTGITQIIPGVETLTGSLTTTSFQSIGGVHAVPTITGTFTPLVGAAQQ
jgi:hypothetical protein